jgi:hypothetical protein
MDLKAILLATLLLVGLFSAIEARENDRDALSCSKYCELLVQDVEACEDVADKKQRQRCRTKALSDGTGRDCNCRKF